jgi:apolipoprotein N-acyltransferase
MSDNRTGQRIQTIMLGLMEPLAHLIYIFGIAALLAFAKFLAAAVFALFGLFLLLRFRKWLRRLAGAASRQSSL